MPPDFPDWREKRDLLWGDGATDEEKNRCAEDFFAAGRLSDAIGFFDRSHNQDGVRRVLAAAVRKGDWFLFRRCRDSLKSPLDTELKELAANALKLGKFMYAFRAFRDLGDSAAAADTLKKLREIHPDSEILIKHLET